MHRRTPRRRVVLAIVSAVLGTCLAPVVPAAGGAGTAGAAEAQAAPQALYHITDLGELGARDAFALDDHGVVVGMLDNSHSYRYDPVADPLASGTVTDLGPGIASAVSEDGTVFGDVYGADPGGIARAVTPDGATAAGSTFYPGVVDPAYGSGISAPGVWTPSGHWNSLYDDGCVVPGLKGGTALGINRAGALVGQGLVGGADFPTGAIRAVALKCVPDAAHPGSYTAYDLFPNSGGIAGAFAINADGVAAGMAQPFGGGSIEAHRWKGEGFALVDQPLGTFAQGHLPDQRGSQSAAYGINDDGDVVGTYGPSVTNPYLARGNRSNRAFIFVAGGSSMLDLTDLIPAGSGWTLNTAFDINDRGQIVGQGTFGGRLRGFVLTPLGDVNITADRIVVTQVVQNEENLDWLVAHKQAYAIVRVHSDTRTAWGVKAELRGYRDGNLLGRIDPVGPPLSVRQHPDDTNAQHSFVFALPPGWTDVGDLRLEATVNSDQRVVETDYEDDTTQTTVVFQDSGPVKILVVDTYFARNPVAAPDTTAFNALRNRMRLLLPARDLDIRQAGMPLRIDEPPVPPNATSNCSAVLGELVKLRATLGLDASTRLYGLVPAEADGTRPYGDNSTNGCSFTPSLVQTGWAGPGSEDTAVHEFVHALGRQHVPKCGAVGADLPGYPADPSDRALVSLGSLHRDRFTLAGDQDLGFDRSTMQFVPSSPSDIMTYCRPRWMSDYTYESVFGILRRPPVDPQPLPGHRADVTGLIDELAGTADVAVIEPLPGTSESRPAAGPYHVDVYDGTTQLADVPFTPTPIESDVAGQDAPRLGFDVSVSLPPGADHVAIRDDRSGATLGSAALGGAAPTVSVSAPGEGAALPASGPLVVAWDSGDADGDPITHSVLYRPDADASWTPLATGVTGTSATVDAAGLAGSNSGMLRVVADDGRHLAAGEVGGLVVPDKPPTVAIDAPLDGATVTIEQDVLLEGSADSPQGRPADSAYEWWSDRDGLLGTGPTVLAQSLSVGTHEIELRVTSPGGQVAQASATLVVKDAGGTPSKLVVSHDALSFAGSPSSPAAGQALEVDDPSGGALDWIAESSDPRVRLSASSGTTPTPITIDVDTSGLLGGESFDATVTLRRSDGEGSPVVVRVGASSTSERASVAPSRLDFGRRAIGTSGTAQTVTVTNHAAAPLVLGPAGLAGPVAGDYALGTDHCSNATLPTGGSCSVEVSFDPHAPGRRPAYLLLADTAGAARWYVSLTGVAASSFASKLVAWGANDRGQLGVTGSPVCWQTFVCESAPVEVPGITGVAQVASGTDHSLVLATDGTVWAFGAGEGGQLGNGTHGPGAGSATPVQVPGLTDVVAVAAARQYSVALRSDGSVWHWGYDPLNGGAALTSPTPVPGVGKVGTLSGVVAIAAGNPAGYCGAPSTGIALKSDGTVVDWGSTLNDLGSGQSSTSCAGGWVVQVQKWDGHTRSPLDHVVSLAPRLAATSDGSVWAWGNNNFGEMGNGTFYSTYLEAYRVLDPAGSGPLAGITAVAAAGRQRYALAADGTAWAWGAGTTDAGMDVQRELGVGTAASYRVTLPMRVQLPQAATALQPGIAVLADGSAYGWGLSTLGQAGVGTLTTPFPPAAVLGVGGSATLDGVSAVAGGEDHHLAVTTIGQGSSSTLTALPPVTVAGRAGEELAAVVGGFDDSASSTALDFHATVDWGDGSGATGAVVTGPAGGPYEVHASHLYAHAGSFDLTIDVVGRSGAGATLAGSASVGAATLTGLSGQDLAVTAGALSRQPVGTFGTSNPAAAESSHTATVDWGDGTAPGPGTVIGPPGGPFVVTGEHAYARAGTYPVVVGVTGDDGATTTIRNQALVSAAPLTVGATFSTDAEAGSAFTGALAGFLDGNPLSRAADYSAVIDWGDGGSGPGAVDGPPGGPYTVTGSHTFATAQPFGVTVTLSGPGGATATARTTLLAHRQRISISAEASPNAGLAPLTTTWRYSVRNDGTERMWAVGAEGTLCGAATYESGDDGSGALDPGEVWSFSCTSSLADAGSFTDTAWATAYPLSAGLPVRSDGTDTTVVVGSDTTPPVVTVTGVTDGATYAPGAVPVAGCSTVDPEPSSAIASEATVATTGGPTDFTVTCSGALDVAGNVGNTAVARYRVASLFTFSGFRQPVDDRPTVNKAKAGSAIPVRFSLGGDRGLAIFADGYPRSQRIDCGSSSNQDGIEETTTAGASSLTYHPADATYSYVWKTEAAWKGTCRQLVLAFADGTTARADFTFTR